MHYKQRNCKKKKIYFYINSLGKGGAERVIIQLANRFEQDFYNVCLITSFKDNDEYILPNTINRVCLEEEQDKGNRIIRNFRLIFKLRKILISDKPDVLISFMQEPNFRAILATFGLNTKTIISVRNDPIKEYPGWIGKIVANYILPLANGCVFQTEDAQKWFPQKLQKKSKIIFNEVSEKFFSVERDIVKNIVSIGRLTKQKNQKLLIEAFSEVVQEFPNEKLLIYGDGVLKKDLQDFINSKKMTDKILLMGTTNNVDIVLSQAKIFVLSSDYEGMPNVLLEALAVGVPSISTNCPCGGPKMLIKSNFNGILIQVGNKEELKEGLLKLLNDKELYFNISNNAKQSALNFKPEIVFQEWKEFVESF